MALKDPFGNPTQHIFFIFQTHLHTFEHTFSPTRISKTFKIPYSNLVIQNTQTEFWKQTYCPRVADPSCKNIMSFYFFLYYMRFYFFILYAVRTVGFATSNTYIRGMNDGVIYFLVIDMDICVVWVGRHFFSKKNR